jgi:hypothetical protein
MLHTESNSYDIKINKFKISNIYLKMIQKKKRNYYHQAEEKDGTWYLAT